MDEPLSNPDAKLRVQGGINDIGFNWKLASGESFVTPQALLCFSSEGIGGMSRSYADFIRDRIVNPRFAYAKRPVVLNNWEATYFDFDTDKLFLSDDIVRMWVDGKLCVDDWSCHSAMKHKVCNLSANCHCLYVLAK